jgi:hypothetical protein
MKTALFRPTVVLATPSVGAMSSAVTAPLLLLLAVATALSART